MIALACCIPLAPKGWLCCLCFTCSANVKQECCLFLKRGGDFCQSQRNYLTIFLHFFLFGLCHIHHLLLLQEGKYLQMLKKINKTLVVLCYLSNFVASMNLVTDFPHFFEFLKLKNAAFRRCILLESNFY